MIVIPVKGIAETVAAPPDEVVQVEGGEGGEVTHQQGRQQEYVLCNIFTVNTSYATYLQ
jgi:hypothetical protein